MTSTPSTPSSKSSELAASHSELFKDSSHTSSPASSVYDFQVKSDDLTDSRNDYCNAIIFDLGDVLFTWSAETKTSISPQLLRKILRSGTWFEYEKGNFEEQEAYELVGKEFDVPSSEVAAAFQGARDSLKGNSQLIKLISELKQDFKLRIYAMSNISAPDWAVLKEKASAEEWALFSRVFTSSEARERKPNLGFFRHVLEETGVDTSKTIFVDDNHQNVLTARSVGLRAIVFDSFENVERQLRNAVSDPVGRADNWLRANAKRMLSVTDGGVTLHENFGPLLIYEATGNRNLVEYVEHPRLFNFFQGGGVMTTPNFPYDLDTTSIGLTVSTHVDDATKQSVMDEMLTYKNKDGIIQTYFDRNRPRIDPIVCTNVLTFFYKNGRGDELEEVLNWVYSVLEHRAYLDGTLYYYGADTFLFFLSRLMEASDSVRQRFAQMFKERVAERAGIPSDAMALAMRVMAAAQVHLFLAQDYQQLLALQDTDGSWPLGWIYKYGGSDILIGNRGLTTAFAARAIKVVKKLRSYTSV